MWSRLLKMTLTFHISNIVMAVTIKKNKFKKTTNTRHVEMNRTAKRQKYKLQKGIISAKKKDLLMLCKKGLTSKQDHAFFDWLPVRASGGKKDDIYSNSDADSEEYESSETH